MVDESDLICSSCGQNEAKVIGEDETGEKQLGCAKCFFDVDYIVAPEFEPERISFIKIHGPSKSRPAPGELEYDIVIYEEQDTEIEFLTTWGDDDWVQMHSISIEDLEQEE